MESQGIPVPKVDWQKVHSLKKKLASQGQKLETVLEDEPEDNEEVDNFVEEVDKPEEPIAETEQRKVIQLKPKTQPPPAITDKSIPEPEQTTGIASEILSPKWEEAITQAKVCISNMSKSRLKVAELALEVCDVRWGGGAHWANHEGTYTLKRFAEEIGLNPKTLSNWVRVKRNVHDKLVEAGQEINPIEDWAAMTRVADKMKHDAPTEDVVSSFAAWDSKHVKAFNHQRYALQMQRKAKSFVHFLENKAKPNKMSGEEMQALRHNCQFIVKWVRDNGTRFK